MRMLLIRVISLCLLFVLQSGRAENVENAPVTSERVAATIAEAAFLKATRHEVTDYSMHPGRHTTTQWYFDVEGEGRFARPGYQWFVSVDRKTGKTKVLFGE